jgi:hypothetical protein
MNTKLQSKSSPPAPAESEVIRRLRQDIAAGKHWYIALLEAVGRWQTAEEVVDGSSYRYLIAGEAFDWLLLAERLCREVNGWLPQDEKAALLFHNKPPLKLGTAEFKKLIGSRKYSQYLDYFYGISVEEALVQAVEDEIRKERRALGQDNEQYTDEEAHRRIYGETRQELLKCFRLEKKYPRSHRISLTELKEFTYWLFKYRLLHNDKARIASDTRKALQWLKSNTDSLSV